MLLPSGSLSLKQITQNFLFGISDGRNIPGTASFWSGLFRVLSNWHPKVSETALATPSSPATASSRSNLSDTAPPLTSLSMGFSSYRTVSVFPQEAVAPRSFSACCRTASNSSALWLIASNNSARAAPGVDEIDQIGNKSRHLPCGPAIGNHLIRSHAQDERPGFGRFWRKPAQEKPI